MNAEQTHKRRLVFRHLIPRYRPGRRFPTSIPRQQAPVKQILDVELQVHMSRLRSVLKVDEKTRVRPHLLGYPISRNEHERQSLPDAITDVSVNAIPQAMRV